MSNAADFVRELGGKASLDEALGVKANYESWMLKVREHEEKRSSGGYSKADTIVEGFNTDSLEMRKFLGYFWSASLYATHHEGKLPQKDGLKLSVFCGKKGVILDKSCGTPLGVEEVWARSEKGVAKRGILADSKAGDNAHDIEGAYKQARRAATVSVKEGENGQIKLTAPKLLFSDKTGDNTDSLLSEIWGGSLSKQKGGNNAYQTEDAAPEPGGAEVA